MRVLLLGDYSNVHATLARGLRQLGVEVVLASDGDGWKDYPRDIDLRRPGMGKAETLKWLMQTVSKFLAFRNFDVVQIINPVFLELRGEHLWPFYRFLRRHNRKVFMGAFGMDHYWVKAGLDCQTFRYSDFNFGNEVRGGAENEAFIRDWLDGPKGKLNRRVVQDCDGIIAGLYEYWASYEAHCPEAKGKMTYIPFPVEVPPEKPVREPGPLQCFIGIQRSRSAYKGTDIMLRALRRIEQKYPADVIVHQVENVPFEEYVRLMDASDIILDQLYSYTPAMNALQAMAQGLVVVGGAEPEYYALTARTSGSDCTLRPIVNVLPNEESVFEGLEYLVQHRDEIARMRHDSWAFVKRYHDHVAVAKQYLEFWQGASVS